MKNHLYYVYWLIRTWPMRWSFPQYKILSFEDTVHEIIRNKTSLSRFGDGEFRLAIGERDIVFQKLSLEIKVRLQEVLYSVQENHLIAIPESLNSVKNYKRSSQIHWRNFININGSKISNLLYTERIYGNSFISRFYMCYKRNLKVLEKVEQLKGIWNNQDILFVEGEFSRLGIGNDLFENSNSIERIICPSENAFEIYEEILYNAKKYGKNKLIILALGPTATILAYDLAKEGYWSLDLGHVDVEYMWFIHKAIIKIPLEGKKAAETSDNYISDLKTVDQQSFDKSIVKTLI